MALNGPRGVQRFDADPAALLEIGRYYETSGELKVPLVTLHTSGDPIVPYWQNSIRAKIMWRIGVMYQILIERYSRTRSLR
jgi:hypothetical protein